MLDLNVIEKEIAELERRNTCYAVCEKLACLYTVRDAVEKKGMLSDAGEVSGYTVANVRSDNSDFTMYARKMNKESLISVLSPIMNDIKVVMPLQYNSIITSLRNAVK